MFTVKLACELPEERGVPLCQWDCRELARALVASGVVTSISHETVRRILRAHALRPWRVHSWLSPKVPRDEAFKALVEMILDLYQRSLRDDERVFCFDEKTNIQPRPRCAPSLGARPGKPVRIEAEYQRTGALNLLAAFDTRGGDVHGWLTPRKRAVEFLAAMDAREASIPDSVTAVYVVLDNLRVHKGKAATAWLSLHPRFRFCFTPVHCSWLNQVEQWFSILQRKLLRTANFPSLAAMSERILAFIGRWNDEAHPFNWGSASVARIMANSPLDDCAHAA